MPEQTQHESEYDSETIKVKHGKVDSLSIYHVTDDELSLIEQGSPNSLFLNFAIFLLSVGTSFLITLLTVDIDPTTATFVIFVLVAIVSYCVGFFLSIFWFKSRKSLSKVFKKIKNRLPPDPLPDSESSPTETP